MADTPKYVSKHMRKIDGEEEPEAKKAAEDEEPAPEHEKIPEEAPGARPVTSMPDDTAAEKAAVIEPEVERTAPQPPLQQAVGYTPISTYTPQQVSLPDRKPKRHHPIRNILILLLIAVLVVGGFAVESMMRVSSTLGSASTYATQLQTAASSGDLASARSALSGLMDDIETLDSVSQEWEWTVIEHVPYIGDDVKAAKTMVDVMDKVDTDALAPALDAYDKLGSADTTDEEKVDAATDLAESLKNAQTVIEESEQELSAAPASHFPQLNNLSQRLSSSLSAVDSQVQTLNAAASSTSDPATLLYSALQEAGLA